MKISNIHNHINIQTFKGPDKFQKKGKTLPFLYNYRVKRLEEEGIFPPYSNLIANFNYQSYKKALLLAKKEISPDVITEAISFPNNQFKQATELIEKGIRDSHILTIAQLEPTGFNKAIKYKEMGFDNNCLEIYAKLNEEETNKAKKLMSELGFTPFIAGNLAKLSEEQIQKALEFMQYAEVNIASSIAQKEDEIQKKCKKLLEQGVNPEYVIEVAELNEEETKRLPEIFSFNIGDINVTDFAKMSKEEYARAKELVQLGVNPNAIYDIILIENGNGDNEDYRMHRKKGYSYSVSAALSALNDAQIDALRKLIKIHPQIKDLFKEEYDIDVIQLQDNDIQEAIFTSKFHTENGTKVTLVQTFDGYGESTQSRTEEYSDNSTSSIMSNKSGVFKAKYDKFGQIRELTELIQDIETGEVTGVIHSKTSNLLQGAMTSRYYDINDFKEGGNITPDMDIETAALTLGEPISEIIKNPDGSITYTEDFQMNKFGINRKYTEEKDKNGNIIYSDYSYTITDKEEEKTLIKVDRIFKKQDENSAINIINGIEYSIQYKNNTKTITISDGKTTKTLDFSTILPTFSENILWETAKNLPVDSLLTIYKNIKKWHYCSEIDSLTDRKNKVLSSGTNTSVIDHEVGHIIQNSDNSIYKNDELIQIYGKEMEVLKHNLPYNEQEFLIYFSPRAELTESDGYSEFIAETNALLNSYGLKHPTITTRGFFIAKYFPESIAKIAEILGKNSRKSLLE